MILFKRFFLVGLLGSALLTLSQTPTSPAAQISAALRAGNFDEAIHLANLGLTSSPADSQLWTLKGIALSSKKETKQALAAFLEALKISPEYLPALGGAAQIEYELDQKHAVIHLRQITRLQPANQTSHAMLAAIAFRQGNCEEAIREYSKGEQLIASQPAALQQYGSCLLRLKQAENAAVVFQQLVASQPDAPMARRALATAQLAANQAGDAVRTLQPLLASDADISTLQLAASAYETTGDTPMAVKVLRDAIVKDPRRVSLYVDFANMAFTHQSFQAGIEMLDSGLNLQPEAAPLYLARGVLYVQLGDFERAQADFDRAEQLDPTQSAAGIAQGLVAEEKNQDDPDKALAVVRTKLAKNPNDGFLHYLEAALIQQKAPQAGSQEFLKGLEAARRSVTLEPTLAAAHDVLANYYLQEGQTELAIGECQAALQHNAKDQTALYRLVVAFRKTDRKPEIPALLKRLAEARQEATKQEGENNRYKLVINSENKPQ